MSNFGGKSTKWVTEPDAHLNPVVDQFGHGAVQPRTVIQVFQETATKHGNRPAMGLKRRPDGGNGKIPKDWQVILISHRNNNVIHHYVLRYIYTYMSMYILLYKYVSLYV